MASKVEGNMWGQIYLDMVERQQKECIARLRKEAKERSLHRAL
jgi:hypothetical protein